MSRVTISVNGLSLIHEDSGGVSSATLPDVCLTPPTLAPTPYPNVALSRDLAGGTSSVRADGGHRIATAGSVYARSAGDEAGSGGGVISGTHGAEATFLTHSFDVAIEGRGAGRLTDKMLHNRGNTLDCSGNQQAHVGPEKFLEGTAALAKIHAQDRKLPGGKAVSKLGIDTNLAKLGITTDLLSVDTAYAHKRHRHFVGRYLAAHDNGSSDGELDPSTGAVLHPGLTRHEVGILHHGGLEVFAIWEKQKYHAISDVDGGREPPVTCSMRRQFDTGVGDAKKASHQMEKIGAPSNRPIYFTVDFTITKKDMSTHRLKDTETGHWVLFRDVLFEYFVGVCSVIGLERAGAYGGYRAISNLFDKGLISYGWQMTFPDEKTGKKPKIDHRAQLQQYDITTRTLFGPNNDMPLWGVNGAGALDFDRAVREHFGQW